MIFNDRVLTKVSFSVIVLICLIININFYAFMPPVFSWNSRASTTYASTPPACRVISPSSAQASYYGPFNKNVSAPFSYRQLSKRRASPVTRFSRPQTAELQSTSTAFKTQPDNRRVGLRGGGLGAAVLDHSKNSMGPPAPHQRCPATPGAASQRRSAHQWRFATGEPPVAASVCVALGWLAGGSCRLTRARRSVSPRLPLHLPAPISAAHQGRPQEDG